MSSPLEVERAKASFDVRQMTYLLEGGEKRCKRKEKIRKYVEEDPVFRNGKPLFSYLLLCLFCFFFSVR